ncbi:MULTISPECIES: hypothetical protein [unclassified Novosphingobium]|jgi:hypothetical protein|uniref:hypothetical protein n=1 Tax=unclassified Novosphingobium TaxID=2644732 RepID=UPI00086BECB4|nr:MULTISPECIES: hypothetical protein [unclassified Novosphingobium]MBN9145693.1 hypothetical protein [Novosphingobium sp.]ODU80704.1 MAG: hypothetical protein ABT10_15895 [Novosphingobium sp. SCN 63-17]OJX87854.1 MAG: hypothetical protein BGP00_00050 [Novosphingobium sp. 63-713]
MSARLVQAIRARLQAADYVDLATPFKLAGVDFAFTGAMRGRDGRALDLVLLVDTTTGEFGDRDGERVRQRVEALSRALDVTGSRYVVTVILAGAILAEGIEALSETCRVLQVEGITLDPGGTPLDEAAREQLNDRIRVLLPLTLPIADIENSGSGPAIDQLVRSLPKYLNKELLDAVIAASIDGEQAVTEAVAGVIDQALQSGTAEEQS